jgi:hypothetical protein
MLLRILEVLRDKGYSGEMDGAAGEGGQGANMASGPAWGVTKPSACLGDTLVPKTRSSIGPLHGSLSLESTSLARVSP